MPDGLRVEVERSAAPREVGHAIERLVEFRPELTERLEDPLLAGALIAVTGASRSLTRLLESRPEAFEVLASLGRRIAPDEDGDVGAEEVSTPSHGHAATTVDPETRRGVEAILMVAEDPVHPNLLAQLDTAVRKAYTGK